MEIKVCKKFDYRIMENAKDVFSSINTCKENVKRNNEKLNFYDGEWVQVTVNDFILHHVKPAETLEQIAVEHNVSCEEIMSYNNLKMRKLYIGQILKIKK